WAAQDAFFDQFFITLKSLPSLNRTQEIFVPGNLRETEFTNLTAGTQYLITLRGSTQGQLAQSLDALAATGIFYGFCYPYVLISALAFWVPFLIHSSLSMLLPSLQRGI
uniref:Fibronectin type-III domain-containing protein n=1 Tax=Gopherus agassizii TaxID=38772 RepID=A0A452HK80_9SAUR